VFADARRRWRLWVTVLALVALVLLTMDLVLTGRFRGLDGEISDYIVANWRAPWRLALPPLTYLGQRGVVVLPLVVVTALALVRTRSLRPLVVVLGALLTTALVVGTMKLGFGRTAPSSGQDIFSTSSLSYPSGHAVNTIVIWTLVLRMLVGLYGERLRALRRPAPRALLVGVIAVANAASMVGLNYHWFTDVLAGWLIGVAIILLWPAPLPAAYTRAAAPESAATPAGSRPGRGPRVPSV
jgi:undecaprenyl-diphosphatase